MFIIGVLVATGVGRLVLGLMNGPGERTDPGSRVTPYTSFLEDGPSDSSPSDGGFSLDDRFNIKPVESFSLDDYPAGTPGSDSSEPGGGLTGAATGPVETCDSGAHGAAGLNSAERRIYNILKDRFTQVARGSLTDSIFEVDVTGLGITVADGRFHGIDDEAIMRALSLDCCYEQYWRNQSKGWEYECSYVQGTNEVTSITIKCEVNPSYAKNTPSGEEYYLYVTDPGKISAANQALRNAQAVVDQCRGLSDYDKLAAYRDYICGQVEYNYAAYDVWLTDNKTSGDPWELIYVFDNDPGTDVVCAGYAKAFKYLCDLSGFSREIDCCLVSGRTSGPHMWNLMRVNGQSYMVDVTGCDSEWGRFGDLFLAGAGNATGNGFTIQCPRHDLDNGSYYPEDSRPYTYDEDTKQVYGGGFLTLAPAGLAPESLS